MEICTWITQDEELYRMKELYMFSRLLSVLYEHIRLCWIINTHKPLRKHRNVIWKPLRFPNSSQPFRGIS